jgi:hypothetical protein
MGPTPWVTSLNRKIKYVGHGTYPTYPYVQVLVLQVQYVLVVTSSSRVPTVIPDLAALRAANLYIFKLTSQLFYVP